MDGRAAASLLLLPVVLTSLVPPAPASDWPQLQHDPQRTGFTKDEVAPPFRTAWYHNFQPELVSRHVQPVTHKGLVFVSTQTGNVYAFAAKDGEIAWKVSVRSPVLHTAACADGKVVVAALNGKIHALQAESGRPVWVFEAPGGSTFSQAPCVAEGKVYISSRQGVFYALDLVDGKTVWERDLGVPVHNTAAYNGGRVYIGGEDIRLRALDAKDGRVVWTSEKLYGQSMREHHPVVTGGRVLVRPMPVHPSREYFNSNFGKDPGERPDYVFQATWSHYDYWTGKSPESKARDNQFAFSKYYLDTAAEVTAGRMPKLLMDAQNAVVEHFTKHPYDQDLFVLNESDGAQAYLAPHFHCSSLPGTVCPPVVAGGGTVVIPWIYISHVWARLDLKRRRAVEIMIPPRRNNGDETLNVSVGGRFLYIFHVNEQGPNAGWSGAFDFTKKTWAPLPRSVPKRVWQMAHNCQSGGVAASISDGRVYHVVFHQLASYAHGEGE